MTRTYEQRVRAYEAEGMTRSDAQGIVDLEDRRASKAPTPTHTPGPWEISYCSNFPDQQTIQAVGSDRILALVDKNDDQDEANAAFIVRACNAHEELVKALEKCVRELQKHENPLNYASSVQLDGLQALALARGQVQP